MVETRLTFDVSTPQLALQARRKISALIIGGWDVISIEEYNLQDRQTGQIVRIREVVVSGEDTPLTHSDYREG